MEGFIHLKMPLLARQVLTRSLVMPVIICVIIYGGRKRLLKTCYFYTQKVSKYCFAECGSFLL